MPGRKPYAAYPADLEAKVVSLHRLLGVGATAIAHVLGRRGGMEIPNDRVHDILQEYEYVTENLNKQGRKPPWVRFERKFSLVTVHMGWFHNSREDWVLAVEDDATRKVLGMIETDAQTAERSVELLNEVSEKYETDVPIIEVITDHGSEIVNTPQDARPILDHVFEGYLAEKDIMHTLYKIGRPQSNGSTRPMRNSGGGSMDSMSSSISTTRSDRT